MGSNLPSPDTHMNVLYRQTYNTYGQITSLGLTQDNRVGNNQRVNNSRLGGRFPCPNAPEPCASSAVH